MPAAVLIPSSLQNCSLGILFYFSYRYGISRQTSESQGQKKDIVGMAVAEIAHFEGLQVFCFLFAVMRQKLHVRRRFMSLFRGANYWQRV